MSVYGDTTLATNKKILISITTMLGAGDVFTYLEMDSHITVNNEAGTEDHGTSGSTICAEKLCLAPFQNFIKKTPIQQDYQCVSWTNSFQPTAECICEPDT